MDFNELKKLNNTIINQTKEALNENKLDESLRRKLILNVKIGELFEKDEALFFNISIEEAYSILAQIVNKDNVKETYLSLTSPKEYSRLKKEFKI